MCTSKYCVTFPQLTNVLSSMSPEVLSHSKLGGEDLMDGSERVNETSKDWRCSSSYENGNT